MARVTGFTAERMLEIEKKSVVSGSVDTNHNLTFKTRGGETLDGGSLAVTPQLRVEDTTSVDLTLTGSGTVASPWLLKADVKDQTELGLLEPTYRGGLAKVKIKGSYTQPLDWLSPYDPSGSRVVRLAKLGLNWIILGQTQVGYYTLKLNREKVHTYAETFNTASFSRLPRAIKLPSGIVVLSGLLSLNGSITYGTVLTYLPEDCRPDKDMIIATEVGDVAASVYIRASDGAILPQNPTGPWVNSYISLDGIAFPAANVATWIPIGSSGSSWGSNFGPRSEWNTVYGEPSFWKDPYGMVWFRGMVDVKIATSADDIVIAKLPPGYVSDKAQHIRGAGANRYSGFGFAPTQGIQFKLASAGAVGDWLSLAGLISVTPEGRINNPWVTPKAFSNNWTNLNTNSYTYGSYLLREDGLRMTNGLMASGTLATRMLTLVDEEYWPAHGRIILSSMANSARARIDVGGFEESWTAQTEPGGLIMQQGSTAWFSLDGKAWVP